MGKIDISQGLFKAAKYLLVIYVCFSVVHSLRHIYESQFSQLPAKSNKEIDLLSLRDSKRAEFIQFPVSSNSRKFMNNQLESSLISKAFSQALGPTDIKSYYYKAYTVFDPEDITLATLVTRDRFKILSRLATNYRGPISAAIHINDDLTKEDVLQELFQLYHSNPDMGLYVDVHLIVDRHSRQFNMWRNVAKLFSRTEYIMMLDVDFHVCTDFRKSIQNNADIKEKLREGNTALVVPAFEYVRQEDGADWTKFPKSKAEVLDEIRSKTLGVFHTNWKRGHAATNYSEWYTSTDAYKVTEYDNAYEPYIIYKKGNSPWCDERFVGYGANKAACLFEIYLSGIDFYVLPNDFIIHQTHKYPEKTRKRERNRNRILYFSFQKEMCYRYHKMFGAAGLLDSPRAEHYKSLCFESPKPSQEI